MKNKIFVGSICVVLAALLWSLDGTFLRPQLSSLPSPVVAFLEHLLGLVVLSPMLFIHRLDLKKIDKKTWATIFWVALFGGALGTTFFTKALFLTGFKDISVVILLQKFQPVFAIVLAAVFLHERFPKSFYIYTAIALLSGYFVTFSDPWTINNLKTATATMALYSLLAAFAWGSSTTFGKYSLKNISYGLLAALRFLFTVLIMLVPVAMFYPHGISLVSTKQWTVLTTIVFTSGAAAMYLYYFGLKKIPASLSALCELAWPVSAIFFDYIFNDNLLSTSQIIAAVVLIISVYRITLLNKSRTISGTVKTGLNNGENTGAKTANLDLELAKNLSKGLYTCTIILNNRELSGLLYYGFNSISQKDCLEVHIFDFNEDIYGKNITVTTDRFLRLPKKFNTTSDLIEQIKYDLKMAKD